MPLPARLQALFDHQAHRFAQRKNQRDRRGVMIQPVSAPIVHRSRQVKIPALHLGLTLAKHFFSGGAHCDRRHSRRGADGLLRSAEANINPLLVHIDGHSRERRYGVHNQQRAKFVRDLAVSIDAGDYARRSLPVSEANHFDFLALACTANIFGVHWFPVRRFHLDDS